MKEAFEKWMLEHYPDYELILFESFDDQIEYASEATNKLWEEFRAKGGDAN